ncbi:MAG: BON domain-containing protein [Rhodospirillales bacterium]|nr:BON domain-containing protein [Rhodospirillales bacterium]
MPRLSASAIMLVLGLFAATTLSGCAGAIVGAGATAGTAAYSERGIDGSAKDLKIETALRAAYLEADQVLITSVGVEVYEGRVLLTGVAKSEQMRAEAVRIAHGVSGVREVLNEIQLSGGGVLNFTRDSWITTQLTTKITIDKEIMAINYSIETVNGTIYLIGIAQNQAEIDRVLAHARGIDYVKNVISHVRVKGAG